ncbi:hypothetical protein SAMN05518849_1151 [Sphingobium sp. AP50]|uniref:hypothetical protein n=1 Tax=Sphingobium sp. AP50 TaxID=1884369 RepID=UPI0008B8AA75|nr:hypothetical protein [Sphingobium sp. AP50]SEJ83351.1 hypothetical protein SAMN05518849_1151 [Sphingobium sp. AP50]
MSPLGSWLDDAASLVGDASIWVNLVATGRAEKILRASPAPHLITATARGELDAGRAKGRRTASVVAELIEMGLVNEVALGPAEEEVFLSLVAGPVSQTLDDGEAATIAFAMGSHSVALIDERKATNLCELSYPTLKVMSTADLLLSAPVRMALGEDEVADALFNALSLARMRVPDQHLPEVSRLLGPERREICLSLPANWRRPSGSETMIG